MADIDVKTIGIILGVIGFGWNVITFVYERWRRLVITVMEDVPPPDYSVMALTVRMVNASRQVTTISQCYLLLPDRTKIYLDTVKPEGRESISLAFGSEMFFWKAVDTLGRSLQKSGYSHETRLRAVVEDTLGKKYHSKKYSFDPTPYFLPDTASQKSITNRASLPSEIPKTDKEEKISAELKDD